MKYYIQINPNFPEANWDTCEPLVMEFLTRADAVNACKLLSAVNGFTDVRFATNENYKSNSGAYVRATPEEVKYYIPAFAEQI